MTTTNKPMTGEKLDELMTVSANMQRESEKLGDRAAALFAYAVQVAVLELRSVRNVVEQLAAENAALKNAMRVTLEHVSVMDTGQAGVAAMIINDALHNSETPATDAILAEFCREAIRKAMDDCSEFLDRDCIMESNGISYDDAALREVGAMALQEALIAKVDAK